MPDKIWWKKKDRKNGEGKFVRLSSKRKLSKSICHEMQIQHGVKNDETPKWTLNCLLFLFDLAGNRIAPIGIMNPATTREKNRLFARHLWKRFARRRLANFASPFFSASSPKGNLTKVCFGREENKLPKETRIALFATN